jgi:16S rRNA (adenine1518-N6/adenine1519-N6)-dimethyltransferase
VDGRYVLEIGPGTAGLTRSILAASPKKLTVIEKDKRCINLLREIRDVYSNLCIVEGDALNLSIAQLIPEDGSKLIIIANLPYNIGTELVFRWFQDIDLIESMTLMLQKEVVMRMRASHSNKDYGRLSVMCQILCEVNREFDVSPSAFYPPPNVHSSIVSLKPRANLPDKEIVRVVSELARLAFGARRKMIRSSLKDIVSVLDELKIDTSKRAENLSCDDYIMIAQRLLNPMNSGYLNNLNKFL